MFPHLHSFILKSTLHSLGRLILCPENENARTMIKLGVKTPELEVMDFLKNIWSFLLFGDSDHLKVLGTVSCRINRLHFVGYGKSFSIF